MTGMRTLHRFAVTLVLRSPFIIAGTERMAWGIDVFQIRNADGLPILPDTHLKGLLRHTISDKLDLIDKLFGKDGAQDVNKEKTGQLMLSDLVAKDANPLKKGDRVSSRTRVTIDDATGTTKRGHLLTVEQVAPLNTDVRFTGDALLWAKSADHAKATAQLLEDAFQLVAAVGRFKTVGYGEVISFSVKWVGQETVLNTKPGAGDRFIFQFGLSKPALIAARILDSNTMESGDVLPGGVIKGALAQQLAFTGHDPRTGALAQALTALHIGQAVPQGQPQKRANDMVQIGKGSTWRRWHSDLHQGPTRYDDTLQFMPDIKDSGDAGSTLDYETRTRLSIDASTQAAKESALFSQTLIRPEDRAGKPVVWQTVVDASACPIGSQAQLAARDLVLAALMAGPATIGKTNARMVKLTAQPAPFAAFTQTGRVRVELTSSALMLRAGLLQTAESYHQALRDYWLHVTDGVYRLANDDGPDGWPGLPAVFARLSYRGGFEARTFRFFGADVLEPFVLTETGSVFVLEPVGHPQPAVLAALARAGLPLVEWNGTKPGKSNKGWADCPFTPENGYGAINLEATQ